MFGTYLHVIQPVLTFFDPFLPECGGRDVDGGESESSPIFGSFCRFLFLLPTRLLGSGMPRLVLLRSFSSLSPVRPGLVALSEGIVMQRPRSERRVSWAPEVRSVSSYKHVSPQAPFTVPPKYGDRRPGRYHFRRRDHQGSDHACRVLCFASAGQDLGPGNFPTSFPDRRGAQQAPTFSGQDTGRLCATGSTG
jgi:hypothetical protein